MALFIHQVVLVLSGEGGTRGKNVYHARKGPVTHVTREAVRSRFEPGNRLPRDVMGLFKTYINCL
jgi:hypothetical protein